MGQRSEWNRAYYGHELGAHQIVLDMQGANPGADPLRDVLTRYGTGEQDRRRSRPAPQSGPQQPPPAANAPTQLQPRGTVQQQTLPPPR